MKKGQFYQRTGSAEEAFRFPGGKKPAGNYVQVVPTLAEGDEKYTNMRVANFFNEEQFDCSDYRHVVQGDVGDCWLLSPMCGLAAKRPDLLEGLFTVGSGNYTVNFYDFDGTACSATITGHLVYTPREDVASGPGYKPRNELTYVGQQLGLVDVEPDNARLWASFLEKGMAEYFGGYQSLDGGDGPNALQACDGFRLLTGLESEFVEPRAYTLEELEAALRDGVVAFTTKANKSLRTKLKKVPKGLGGFKNLLEDHAYLVDRVEDDMIILYNPHGELPHLRHNVAEPLTWAELVLVGARFDILPL
jgi:hypothetical protein